MKKRLLSLLLAVLVLAAATPAAQAASPAFSDVPSDGWAAPYIEEAVSLGVISGYGGGVFGYGDTVTRAQFAAMLVRLFGWETVSPDTSTFTDNADKTAWYYDEVETADAHGAVTADTARFRPNDAITRSEMAVMLVRALGYDTLAKSLGSTAVLPFTDVTEDRAYIAMAYDFGIINGMSATTFAPDASATREQAAAMMIRLHDRSTAGTDWLHAFYAFSSYGQSDVISSLDAVSFGWSRLETDASGTPVLNLTTSGGNDYYRPTGYTDPLGKASAAGVSRSLDVFSSTSIAGTAADGSASDACSAALLTAGAREKAVAAIVAAVRGDDYTGVTIDFENLRGQALREGFTAFLQALRSATQPLGLTLTVCVQVTSSFDGYDYRAIGDCADHVVLMAHDYAAQTLTAAEMAAGFTETPETPIYAVYEALRAVTDSETGVQDRSKIALALSFASTEWKTSGGKVLNSTAYSPLPEAVYNRLLDPSALLGYSATYQNPYLKYHNDEENADYLIWYEDARSVAAKVELARMFGVDGVSLWRLGMIPDYGDDTLHYNVLDWLLAQ